MVWKVKNEMPIGSTMSSVGRSTDSPGTMSRKSAIPERKNSQYLKYPRSRRFAVTENATTPRLAGVLVPPGPRRACTAWAISQLKITLSASNRTKALPSNGSQGTKSWMSVRSGERK